MHPIVRGIYFDFVTIYTGAKRLSRGTDLCDGKLLVNQTIPSGYLMEGTGRFDIYLPSGYVGSGKKYPVLYLLHGLGYNPGIWESRMNLTRLVDEFVRDGAIEPILLSRILSMFDAYVQADEPGTYVLSSKISK